MDKIGNIGPTNLELFKLNLGNNVRPLQQIGDRKVFYNSGSNINTLDQRIEKLSDDKFLRCKKKPIDNFKEKDIPLKTKPKEQEKYGFSKSFKKNIKLFSTVLVFILIILNSYNLVKYLFKYEYAQRLVISIVGIGSYKKGDNSMYDNTQELLNDWRSKSQERTSASQPSNIESPMTPSRIKTNSNRTNSNFRFF